MSADDDRASISRATTTLLDSVNAGDVAGVLSVWADDGELLPPNHPPVQGRAALEEYFRNLFSHSRLHFLFTSSHVQLFGNLALERVSYTARIWRGKSSPPISDRGKGLHVYRRDPSGAWKLIHDVWSSNGSQDAPPAP